VEAKYYVVRWFDSTLGAPNPTLEPQKLHRSLPKYHRICYKNHRIRYKKRIIIFLNMTNRQTKPQEFCTPAHRITPYPNKCPFRCLYLPTGCSISPLTVWSSLAWPVHSGHPLAQRQHERLDATIPHLDCQDLLTVKITWDLRYTYCLPRRRMCRLCDRHRSTNFP
jgi:hypothetical protein